MKFTKLTLCLLIFSFASSCSNYTTVRQHKNFSKVFSQKKSVVILTGDVFIVQESKNGKTIVLPNEQGMGAVITDAERAMKKKGYKVKGVISEEDAGSEAGEAFKDLYSYTMSQLYANKAMGKKKKALAINRSFGLLARKFTRQANADMLLVLNYTGKEMSQEMVTKNFVKDMAIGVATSLATNGQSAGGNRTHIKDGSAIIGLIDVHSGDLLWTNMGTDFEGYGTSIMRMVTKKSVMKTAFERAFKKLPDKNGG